MIKIKLKKQVKGITWVALVVTIIVLLILSGVAISLSIGEDGIFRRAQEGAKVYQNARENEKIELDKVSNYIQNILASGNLTDASIAQLQQYLSTFDVAKFIKSYGPFNSTAEISAALYAVTSGMVKRQEEE